MASQMRRQPRIVKVTNNLFYDQIISSLHEAHHAFNSSNSKLGFEAPSV